MRFQAESGQLDDWPSVMPPPPKPRMRRLAIRLLQVLRDRPGMLPAPAPHGPWTRTRPYFVPLPSIVTVPKMVNGWPDRRMLSTRNLMVLAVVRCAWWFFTAPRKEQMGVGAGTGPSVWS